MLFWLMQIIQNAKLFNEPLTKTSPKFEYDINTIMIDKTKNQQSIQPLIASQLDSPLGPMFAIANDKALWYLKFAGHIGFDEEIKQLNTQLRHNIILGTNQILKLIAKELKAYFSANSFTFTTPIHLLGTAFQLRVWQALMQIPVGTTISYLQLAKNVGNPKAYRAVANANGANPLTIIIPCHRVINANNKLGGYGGGIHRKKWLLEHEQQVQ